MERVKKVTRVKPVDLFIDLSDDEELMRLMVQAGFYSVFVGIETPNEKSLSECNKSLNMNRDLIACVRKMQKFGLEVDGGFIVGFDSDPPSIFERQIKFIQKSEIVTAMVGLLNAPRDTRLYQRLKKGKRLLKDSLGDLRSVNFIPKMSYEMLIDGYEKIVKTIYSPPYYYERVRRFLKNYNLLPKGGRFRFSDLVGFFMSILVLGIAEKERFYYWRLFLRLCSHAHDFSRWQSPIRLMVSIFESFLKNAGEIVKKKIPKRACYELLFIVLI